MKSNFICGYTVPSSGDFCVLQSFCKKRSMWKGNAAFSHAVPFVLTANRQLRSKSSTWAHISPGVCSNAVSWLTLTGREWCENSVRNYLAWLAPVIFPGPLWPLCCEGHKGLKTMTHMQYAAASLMRHTHKEAMLAASLIRYTTVNILTQCYLELQLALAETTQTAHKSP